MNSERIRLMLVAVMVIIIEFLECLLKGKPGRVK